MRPRSRVRSVLAASAAAAVALAFGCEAVLGLGDLKDRSDEEGGAPADGAVDGPDGSSDALPGDPIFNNVADPTNWDFYDLSNVNKVALQGFTGGTFDGRYLYLAPTGTHLFRLDTKMAPDGFANGLGWTATPIRYTPEDGGPATAAGCAGAVYDGARYVYLVPGTNNTGFLEHIAVRYDTTSPVADAGAWEGIDLYAHFAPHARAYIGAVYDGTRYLYYVPNGQNDLSGVVLRYDTNAPFQEPTSWERIDLTTLLTEQPAGYIGGVFVAPYLYLVPSATAYVTRYDAREPLDAATSWATFDITTVAGNASGYAGAAVLGTSIFFAPFLNNNDPHYNAFGGVLKYEVQSVDGFTNSGSWQRFDTRTLPSRPEGFYGAAADGRFVYFAPQYRTVWDGGAEAGTAYYATGQLARYDTTAPFDAGDAGWQSFGIQTLNAQAVGFAGAIFDGTYVYFVPFGGNAVIARFRARRIPASPPFAPSFL
jgi:hypothetical protein